MPSNAANPPIMTENGVVSVGGKTVKKEQDERPYYEPPIAPSAKAKQTSVLDNQLAPKDFFQRICLVLLKGGECKLWPALKYESIGALQAAVKTDLIQTDLNLGASDVIAIQTKIFSWSSSVRREGKAVAYLLGQDKVKNSLVSISDERMLHDFFVNFDAMKSSETYKNDAAFHKVDMIIRARALDSDDEDEDGDDDATVGYVDLVSPKQEDENEDGDDDVMVGYDGLISPTQKSNEASSNNSSANKDEPLPTCAAAVGDKRMSGAYVTGAQKKKPKKAANPSSGAQKKMLKQAANFSKVAKKKAPKRAAIPSNAPEKGLSTKTPRKSKASVPAATVSVVTPAKDAVSLDKAVAAEICHIGEAFTILSDAEAWKILMGTFGITCIDGNYFLPNQEKPIATSLLKLREDLCVHGLPIPNGSLSYEERVNIARWVRFTHVRGMSSGQIVKPEEFGRPLNKFIDAWGVLRDNFGCKWSSGKYTIPPSPQGEKKQVFEQDHDVRCFFAHHGITCLPEDVSSNVLSKADLLSLCMYFATPPWRLVKTFERAEDLPRRRRRVSRSL